MMKYISLKLQIFIYIDDISCVSVNISPKYKFDDDDVFIVSNSESVNE